MAIHAVTLDFWGTLLHDPTPGADRHRPRRLADFAAILARAGVHVGRADLEGAYDASGAVLDRIWSENLDVPVERHVAAILDAVDPGLAPRLPAAILEGLAHAYARPALLAPPRVADAAGAALSALRRRGYTLCVVSNAMRTPGAVLREILRRNGLLGYFAQVTFSDECGVRKPDPEIFRRTLRVVAVAPDAAVHVGDDPTLDVRGARAAGMRAIQVRAAPPGPGDPEPDVAIPGLAALPDAVERLARL